ncbi:MAG: trypsin-like peptidase domain-containing protein [Clostridia bacterium]|nr:trypsin-like peptidase domain-containing protein [Clostridia bacterium]
MEDFENKENIGQDEAQPVPVAENVPEEAQVPFNPVEESAMPFFGGMPESADDDNFENSAPVNNSVYTPYEPVYNTAAPVPNTAAQSAAAYKANNKGRKLFFVILAIVIAISVVAIPVSLISNKDGSDSTQSDEFAPDGNAPSININETPTVQNGSAPAGAVLTPEQVYEKIADINVAVVVYKNNVIYTEGTGIIMKEDDAGKYTYILTCAHVISDSGVDIVVQFANGERHNAQVVGYDARTDVGVLRIQATGFKIAEFGDSDALKVGSTVYAIGNPGGSALFGTFTDGKVSAIGRNITSSIGYDMVCIQHNAAISPGNSGGALVNEYGQVIGINSSKIAATEYEGISFSVPISQAMDVINKVMAHGYVPGRAKLGISYLKNDSSSVSEIYSMAVQMMDLPSGSLVIYSIDPNSGLANTEAQPGDMIIAVNGKKLDTPDVLLELIEESSVGDVIELTLFRIESTGRKYETSEFKVKAKLVEENNRTQKEETTTRGVYGNGNDNSFNFGF